MKQLVHNGVLIPQREAIGFSVGFRGREIHLSLEQEEMAIEFVKKLGSDYAKDSIFVNNFLKDLKRSLGLDGKVSLEDFEFSDIKRWVDAEKMKRESMTKEERRAAAEERKRIREANKERYGYALIDGERVEINYAVEPPCIFIGRGKNPLRGRWKPRVRYGDIILNLSPDAPTPPVPDGTSWGGRVFDRNGLWIAKWKDKLTDVWKYVWIAETAPSKQKREIDKFNLAKRLKRRIGDVHSLILEGLRSDDEIERMIATAAYFIDELKLRVGDEKDPDELDTVGVTTLEKDDVKILSEDEVEFNFLGKGAVRFHKSVKLPPEVVSNLKEFIGSSPNERIFPELRSEKVNSFLAKAMRGLTSKVFRTYHASEAVRRTLSKFKTHPGSPEFKKIYVAGRANLEAAKILNHKRMLPKGWHERVAKQESRVMDLKAKLESLVEKPKTRARSQRERKLRMRLWEAKLKLKLMRKTRNYNLSTSLNSYIDPRIYAGWASEVSYDWKKVYPKGLQKKFAWIETQSEKWRTKPNPHAAVKTRR